MHSFRERCSVELVLLFIGIMFILSLSFYGINVHYSHLKKIKYIAVFSPLVWLVVWAGYSFGWVLAGLQQLS